MSYRKSRTQHDKISLSLTYSTYHIPAEKKNNVYQPHSKNIHRLYNTLLPTMSEQDAENVCLQLADVHHIQQTCSLHVEVGRKNTDTVS